MEFALVKTFHVEQKIHAYKYVNYRCQRKSSFLLLNLVKLVDSNMWYKNKTGSFMH